MCLLDDIILLAITVGLENVISVLYSFILATRNEFTNYQSRKAHNTNVNLLHCLPQQVHGDECCNLEVIKL